MRPTAEPVLAHARQVIALTSDLADWAERTRTGRAGELRVGMIDAAAVGHFTDVLRQFRDDHPELHLTLRVAPSGELLDEIESGDLDLAVVVGGHTRRGVHTESLMNEPLAVFTPARGLPRDVTAWGHGCCSPRVPTPRDRRGSPAAPRRADPIVAESNQPEVLRTMVELGVGSTVLPVVQAGSDFGPGRVIAERTLVLARRDAPPLTRQPKCSPSRSGTKVPATSPERRNDMSNAAAAYGRSTPV